MAGVVFPGFVKRLETRLRELGYERDGRIMYGRFAADHGYRVSLVQGWMRGATPTYEYLERLAKDFKCELSWLLLGGRAGLEPRTKRRRPVPIRGGSGAAAPLPAETPADDVPLIRPWRQRAAAWWAALEPLTTPAAPAWPLLLVRA